MKIAEVKAEARREGFAQRAQAHSAPTAAWAATSAADHLLSHLDSLIAAGAPAPAIASGYLPIRTEIDPRPAMEALLGRGIRVCVPVIVARAAPLAFREWNPGAALVPGPFGASVPRGGAWLEPDLLLVPLVSFDAGRGRLGYGGGFYDRTLAKLRARAPRLAVGIAYQGQFCPSVPLEPTDAPLDAVVTETGVLC
ncbi:5-formyltetrahydrofolate cyclo-ligase [Paroceanicella profunda]|uniref:5-formyltetrahydrofolate cyclo-ligase n=1 Tax=Paroceanicella profunda TaxID=2579971 RepID=A0A5B8FU50_9RHOB|nr:5-formyltetrahydrofolate cyclo-ligase [Paroceanicella profunda]QDL91915.1 5-formyltetrahydrofolate cyclo-ligase [Paroceanicella profunda]